MLNVLFFVLLGIIYSYLLTEQIVNLKIISILKFVLAIFGTIVSVQLFISIENKLSLSKIVNFISKYTFPIYLMHTIFSASIRIVLLKIGIYNFYIHFVLGLLFGILMPVIIAFILEKSK